jgi:hypothetical protein
VKSVGDSFLAILDNPMASRSSLSTNARFPHVAMRALQMLETLEIDGFVSFG